MENTRQSLAAQLAATGLSTEDAVRLLRNMDELRRSLYPGTRLRAVHDAAIYHLGLQAWQQAHRSACFTEAAEQYLRSKPYLRPRTVTERRQIIRRLAESLPRLMKKRLSDYTADDCTRMLESAFTTPSARNKARRHLNGLFRYAKQRGWCAANPFAGIPPERVQEKTVTVLSLPQVKALLQALRCPSHRNCAPAVGLMLWAGVRPYEVARLHWEDLDLQEHVLYLRPQHSKTGGARQITLHPVLCRHLHQWLSEQAAPPAPDTPLTPPNWARRWKKLRLTSGLNPWREDTLRHTYASYHLKYFRDPLTLQWEMGHSSPEMLRTRYLNMRGITAADAAAFWGMPAAKALAPRRRKGRG